MSNLRHWRARTTSATSSSTSATRRVAVAEELLRDLSKLGPLGLCPLSRCILLLQHAVSLSPARRLGCWPGMSPRLPVRPLPWLGPVEASQAHCPADPCFAQMCRERFRSAHSCALWRPCRACVLPSRSLAHHPGLRCCLHSPARARGAPWFSSQATVELRPSRWLQRCSVPAFWFLHVLHAPDAVLHGPPWRLPWRLPNSESSVCAHGCRGRAGYLNCGLAPCTPDIR